MTNSLRVNLQKISLFITLPAAVTIFASGVLAQDATNTGTTRRQVIQQKIDTRKEVVQNRLDALREKISSREAILKAKLATFKDKRKAEIAERVNTNLSRINKNQTDQMKRHLDRMSQILAKLQSRVSSGSPDIKDVNLANSAIASASSAIASASAAVTQQALNDYTIQATSEANIRKDAQAARNKLHTDLKAVRKLVIDAKQAVANAIRVAKSGKLEIPGKAKEGTQSGQ